MTITSIAVSMISDGGAQMRVEMRPETVSDYADDMLAGATLPPIIVYHDGQQYWLGDGYHRLAAARKIKRETIDADVRNGTFRDAILCGVGANSNHGLRRTQADKRRAVERLLMDPEWAQLSDRKIAEFAKVDHKTVGKLRLQLSGEIPSRSPSTSSGEIPADNGSGNSAGKSPGLPSSTSMGKIPDSNGKPNGRRSLIQDLLQSVSDETLIAECRRRGLTVDVDV